MINFFALIISLLCLLLPAVASVVPLLQHSPSNNSSIKSKPCHPHRHPFVRAGLTQGSDKSIESSAGCINCQSSLKFAGDAAKKLHVGNNIPTLSFTTKDSWAGNMPISDLSDDSYYFFLWAQDSPIRSQDLVIFLNGGPDCSGLLGMLLQTGPFIYPAINKKPHPNAYSWTRSANILYVEQPIGNGFTTGTPTDQSKAQFAKQFDGFLINFFKTFPELKGSKIYFAGESYAGVYTSHIMNYQYKNNNIYNVKGALIINGLISDPVVQADLVTYDFAVKYAKTIGLTDGDLAIIKEQSDQCHYTLYSEQHLRYPASGNLPSINQSGCNISTTFDALARKRKADYNVYRVTTPSLFPELPPTTTPLDDKQLQTYINAPHTKWKVCKSLNFRNPTRWAPSPTSFPSYSDNVLQHVIESSTAGVIIMHGQQDARLLANGTAIVLQNLTWNGAQGFRNPPSQTLIDTEGKRTGTFVKERGLTFALVPDAGHMVALDAPATALAALETLLGQRQLSG